MIRINLFKKEGVYTNLLIGTFEKDKINMPLYNTDITIWKGVDNTIEFSIRNHDRKSINISGDLFFTMINQETQQIFKKKLSVINQALGRYCVILTNDEMKSYDCGTFIGHVSVVNNDIEDLLYSGVDWYPYFNVILNPNKMELVEEPKTITLNQMIKNIYTDPYTNKTIEEYISSMFKSDKSVYHDIIANVSDFVGEIIVQGSLMDTPQHNDDDWFDICEFKHWETQSSKTNNSLLFGGDSETEAIELFVAGDSETEILDSTSIYNAGDSETEAIEFTPLTDTILMNSVLNCLWLRIKFKRELNSIATINEITYRN